MGQAVIIQLKLLTQRRSATKPQPKTELTADYADGADIFSLSV